MKITFNNEQYRQVLNYDSYGRRCLKFSERIAVHAAISHRLTYERDKDLKHELAMKVLQILTEIKDNGYKDKEVRIKEQNGELIEINNEI